LATHAIKICHDATFLFMTTAHHCPQLAGFPAFSVQGTPWRSGLKLADHLANSFNQVNVRFDA
jgi:hypothetical protein